MSLTNEQKKHYRSLGHNLKPVVTVAGNGLSESVLAEIERAISDHELIKIKIAITDRELRKKAVADINDKIQSTLIQEIGKVALILRRSPKPNIKLSNLLR